ncbi:MFS transporter [Rhodococcoides fascians A25f]|uniref:MFS transporter n=1 Tax=Rhodococcoides fascians TaxID=1828 RepID=UPI000ACF28B3|nr:MFS transporter [Rhodococcus fascians]QII04879.1 MFS transporter [Rhodococcus fascians A25f]
MSSPPGTQLDTRTTGTTGEVFVCAAAGFTTLLDSAVLGIGIPAIRGSLGAGTAEVQWILASYSLTFGLALVPAGRLGDVIGRRRLFLCGLALFSVMGLLGAMAADPWMVVAARLGQGVGAGVVSSQVLGIITDRFSGRERARALGAYSTAGGVAGLCGPVLGGALLGWLDPDVGWRVLLMLNVPFAVVTLILAVVYLRPDRIARQGVRVDSVGLLALGTATLLLLLPLVSSMAFVFSMLSVAASGAMLVGFWLWERRFAAHGGVPVLLPALLARRGYVLGTLVAMFWFGAVLALNAVLSLYLIEGLGFSALRAALVMAGSSLMMAVTSAFGWRLVSRFGRSAVVGAVVVEIAVVAGYIGTVNTVPREHVVIVFVVLAAVSGVASGLVDAPNRGLTLEYAPAGASGVAAAFLQLSQRLSATISLAAVSGIYLGILGSSAGGYGRAVAAGLGVCLAMLLLSLVFAIADARRRRRGLEGLKS